MAQLRIGCVVMAAGNARRFGENKLAVQVQGKTLFRRALEAVPAERFVRTVVVSQYPEVLELAHRMGFVPVPNRHPDWGISHTISLGLGKLPEMDAALFQVADQPLLRRESVGSLVDFYREHPEHIAALGHGGVRVRWRWLRLYIINMISLLCRIFCAVGFHVKTRNIYCLICNF